MYTLNFENHVVRKANASGAGNDCVYLTSPDEAEALVVDSKRWAALRVSPQALAQFVNRAGTITA